jgi:regulator of sirC expression with transglutaminase-like and TPR domain
MIEPANSERELQALLQLLDDPDQEIYTHVSYKLASYGPEIIPKLETYWEEALDSILQERIEHIIRHIQFHGVQAGFKQWLENDAENLYKGALLVARFQYADLDEVKLRGEMDYIRRAIWLEMNYNLTPFEQINVFNHVFYSLMGFTGKSSDKQFSLPSFFINQVVESKRGNSISLGILYLILAQELDMPVYGVNLPRHFVACYTKDFLETLEEDEDLRDQIICYINPLNRGTIFTRNEVTLYLKKIQEEPAKEHYLPIRNRETIKIYLQYLKQGYETDNNTEKLKELDLLLRLF